MWLHGKLSNPNCHPETGKSTPTGCSPREMCPPLLDDPVEGCSPVVFHLNPSPSSCRADWSVAGKLEELV